MSDRPHDEDFQQWRDEITVEGFKALVLERDDLRAQVMRLTKQRDTARKERDGMVQRRYRWKEAVEERNAAVKERDELLAQVARLEGARAELRERNASLMADREFWMDAARAFREKRDRLRAALAQHGRHADYCCSPSGHPSWACTCGFADTLRAAR